MSVKRINLESILRRTQNSLGDEDDYYIGAAYRKAAAANEYSLFKGIFNQLEKDIKAAKKNPDNYEINTEIKDNWNTNYFLKICAYNKYMNVATLLLEKTNLVEKCYKEQLNKRPGVYGGDVFNVQETIDYSSRNAKVKEYLQTKYDTKLAEVKPMVDQQLAEQSAEPVLTKK